MALRRVALVGGAGSLGPYLLRELEQSNEFGVTVIKREGSHSSAENRATEVFVPRDYPEDTMVEEFQGHDAVILCIPLASQHHTKLIRASIAAGVRRTILSTFGNHGENQAARDTFPNADDINEMVQHCRSLERPAWSWSSIACGLFFDYCIQVGLLGVSVKDKTAYMWDDGSVTFTATTREHIAIAVRNSLLKPSETANRILHVSSVECSMNDILATAKKISGSDDDDWKVTQCDSAEQIAQAKHDQQHGETAGTRGMALGRLALLVNLREECEPNYRRLGVLDNELLGVPQLPFEDVLRQAFGEAKDPVVHP